MKLYQVGGSVRDMYIDPNIKPKDIDYAVETDSYEAMKSGLKSKGYKIFMDKPQFLTVRAKHPTDGQVYDFTMCREDGVYMNARHPDTVKACDIYTDLSRRDFTVNSIAINEQGTILDPHNGVRDIETRTLRCVGNAKERLREDSLRILRAFRFAVTKGFTFDAELNEALQDPDLYKLLSSVSKERKMEELIKMMNGSSKTAESLTLLAKYPKELVNAIFVDGLWLQATYKNRQR